ncbi:MAG: sulfatase [Planctomycetota bacterium]|nr:sulfatase [Planctomycetota bacterium]
MHATSTPFLAGVLLLAGCSMETGSEEGERKPNRVILVVLDTLRADHLTAYGCERLTAPFLNSFASRSAIFDDAWAPSSWTAPSTASLFTGVYPRQHGVVAGYGVTRQSKARASEDGFAINRIPSTLLTLPQILHDEGLQTYGIADNPNVCAAEGFDAGFDQFITLRYESATAVNERLGKFIQHMDGDSRPAFVYLHYIDPHEPYVEREAHIVEDPESTRLGRETRALYSQEDSARQAALHILRAKESTPRPERVQELLAKIIARYDSEIHFVDARIQEALQMLKVGKDDLVIITADHGEEFLEHGQIGHPLSLYPELLRIPLFISWPNGGVQASRVQGPASLVDLVPTILDALQIECPPWLSGVSLLPATRGEPLQSRPLLFSRIKEHYETVPEKIDGFLEDGWLYLERHPQGERLLFNLKVDPWAQNDLARKKPKRMEAMSSRLQERSDALPQWEREFTHRTVLDADLIKRLNELGYATSGE